MKIILLKEFNIGLTRIRAIGSEIDLDTETATRLIEEKIARPSEKELMAKAISDKKAIISKPATVKGGDAAPEASA